MDLKNDKWFKVSFNNRFTKFSKKKLHNYLLYSDCEKKYFIYKLEMNCICSKNVNKIRNEIFDMLKQEYKQFQTKNIIEYKFKKYQINVHINHESHLISIEKTNY